MKKSAILGVLLAVVLGFNGCEKPISEPNTVKDCEDKYDKLKENLEKEVKAGLDARNIASRLARFNRYDMELCIKKVNCKESTDEACKKIIETEYDAPELYKEVGIKYR